MEVKIQLIAGAIALALAQGAGAQQSTQQKGAQPATNSTTSEQGGKPQLMTLSVDHTRAMDGLLRAAQQLRESIQELAQQNVGSKRSTAIDAAHRALLDTQQAMLELPADLRVESKDRKAASDWPKAMARLDQAAETLRESVDAMSEQQSATGSGKTADKAIASVRNALEETQQAMMALPDYSS